VVYAACIEQQINGVSQRKINDSATANATLNQRANMRSAPRKYANLQHSIIEPAKSLLIFFFDIYALLLIEAR
jgi:hypothetical protein